MAITKIPIRCPKTECRSRDITIVGTSNCTCGNCGEKFTFPGARLIKEGKI